MKYCKWHNATSHETNDCKIFKQQIQLAIEQGRLKFETPTIVEKPMKIDQHPFPTNIVEVSSKDTSRVKLLTSDSAQNKGAVDPKVQVTAADVKGKGLLLEEGESKPRRPVMSQMLINKFQCQQEKARKEKSGHDTMKDIGHVCSSSTAGKKGSSCRQQKIIQSATGLTIVATHP
jgi:hypothetical protein